jgi:hypothetical protein
MVLKVISFFIINALCFLCPLKSFAQAIEWSKEFFYEGVTEISGLEKDSRGDHYIIGQIDINKGFYIHKYDTSGAIMWKDTSLGWINIYGTAMDKYNNLYVIGFFGGSIRFGNDIINGGSQTNFIAKYNSNGKCLWVKQNNTCSYNAITINNDFIFIQGSKCNGEGGYRIASFNLDGEFLWETSLPEHSAYKRWLTSNSKGEIFYGHQSTGALDGIFKLDSDGNILWHKRLPGYLKTIKADSSGNCYIITEILNSANFDGHQVYSYSGVNYGTCLAKLNSSATFDWAITPDDSDSQSFINMHILDSSILITGRRGMNGSPSKNIFYSDISPAGVQRSTHSIVLNEEDHWGMFISFYSPNSVYIAGKIRMGEGNHIYLTKIRDDSIGTLIIDTINNPTNPSTTTDFKKEKINDCIIYPNPSRGNLSITGTLIGGHIEIRSINGSIVYLKNNIQANTIELEIPNLKAGIYLIKVSNGNSVEVRKVIFME